MVHIVVEIAARFRPFLTMFMIALFHSAFTSTAQEVRNGSVLHRSSFVRKP